MLLSVLVGERTKTVPADATVASHALLVRAGFIKAVANGIWSLATPAVRIARKIENIVREEMDAIGGQEVSFPVAMPGELWTESGRYDSVGDELLRFKDRYGRDMVLGMTHEEAAVQFCRDAVKSYNQLPFMIYQIQTKFRDEARSRGGLIRVREFVMKDAYSFHIDNDDLERYYYKAYDAYERIFERIGLKRVVSVKSDTGMMGGKTAHEFVLLTEAGEDRIVLCPECGYRANMDVAVSARFAPRDAESSPLREVYTADLKNIAEVCGFLKVPEERAVKAVCYFRKGSQSPVVCFVRGDLEINESKLKAILSCDVIPAVLENIAGLHAGNIGPSGLRPSDAEVLYDASLKRGNNLVCGANKAGFHYIGLDMERDLPDAVFSDISKVKPGENCPICGKPLSLENGIEVGNIFQLGRKYTEAMGMSVLNKEGKAVNPVMGCYGIGIGRAIASIAEESRDDRGLIWPMSVAPWQVYLCPLRYDNSEVRELADKLYADLQKRGAEVLYDDRTVSAGVKFADCDLMGIPIRLVISPRSLEKGVVELQTRDKSERRDINIEETAEYTLGLIRQTT